MMAEAVRTVCALPADANRLRVVTFMTDGYVGNDFEVIDLDEPRSMRGVASGALAGTGQWRLFEQDGVTAVLYEWNVETTKLWMNVLGPVAARRLLETRGYAHITARDLVAESGTNLGSIGYHFGSKAELLNQAIEHAGNGSNGLREAEAMAKEALL